MQGSMNLSQISIDRTFKLPRGKDNQKVLDDSIEVSSIIGVKYFGLLPNGLIGIMGMEDLLQRWMNSGLELIPP